MLSFIIILETIFCTVIVAEIPMNQASKGEMLVAFSQRVPFVFRDRHNGLKGLDVTIIENFAKKFHIKLNYMEYNMSLNKVFNKEDSLGNVLLKRNLQKCDIFMGGLDESLNANKYFIGSRSYYHDVITWCVRTKQPIPSHKNLLYLCRHVEVWLIYTFMCVCVVFTGYFMQQFETGYKKWDWFKLTFAGIAPCLGFISEYAPKIVPNRIFFIFAIFGATLSYIVTTSLFLKITTYPIFENQIKTIEEIIDNEFELAGDGFTLQHLKTQHQKYPTKFFKQFETCKNLDKCLSQLEDNPKLAVAISREHSSNNHFIAPSQLYCFEKSEIIHSYHVKFLLNRGFRYQKELNRFIQMSSASGLIGKWYSNSRIRATHKNKQRVYGILTFKHFRRIFFRWIMLELIVILVFLLEKLVHKRVQNNGSIIYKRIEMFIDPYRHFWLEDKGSWL